MYYKKVVNAYNYHNVRFSIKEVIFSYYSSRNQIILLCSKILDIYLILELEIKNPRAGRIPNRGCLNSFIYFLCLLDGTRLLAPDLFFPSDKAASFDGGKISIYQAIPLKGGGSTLFINNPG